MQIPKRFIGYAFSTVVLFAMLVLFMCLPQSVFAAPVSGDVVPEITCTYTDANGQSVDGNHLKGGETYNVSFVLDDVSEMSVVQVSATYTEDVTVASAPTALLSDSANDVSSMGYVIGDGNLVFGFVSDNATCSDIGSSAVLATVQATFNVEGEDIDAEGYLTVSENPNLTFALTDYTYGYSDEYAIDTAFEGYNGSLYPMTADVSPSFGFSVTGNLVIGTGFNDATNGTAVYGTYTVSVYSDAAKTDLVQSVTSEYVDGATPVNTFALDNLTAGTYYAVISSDYSLPRTVTITVSDSAIDAGAISMICCDFDQNSVITSDDATQVFGAASKGGSLSRYCELDGNGVVTADDATIVFRFAASSRYPDLVIE
ncbi:MAG: hypothetical protein J5964_04620 [Eubacterium sp.]|nr:hypothetical protein [Eubacterium sp.]